MFQRSEEELEWLEFLAPRKEHWERLGDPVAARIMSEGLELKFHTSPPLSLSPPSHIHPSHSQLPSIREFLPGLLSRRIIRKVHKPLPLHFSRLFVVPKKDGPNRLIIDLSFLNTLLVVPTFKMERISEIASGIVHPMWGCTVDLKDAFYHVPMAWAFHVFFAFVVDGQTYVFQVMPFGLSVAPWAFSKNTKPIKFPSPSFTVPFHTYLDDFLLAPSRESLVVQTSYILSLLQQLGLRVHLTKSQLAPSQMVEYLSSSPLGHSSDHPPRVQGLQDPVDLQGHYLQ